MTRRWTIGPVCVLRHAGMPFDWLAGLGAPDALLRAARLVLDRETAVRARAPHEETLDRALRHGNPDLVPAGRTWPELAAWAGAVQAYHARYTEAEHAARAGLRKALDHERVREAVFLSNPTVYRTMLLPVVTGPVPPTARWRRAYRQLYTYLQRFCAKNETVSFFGPMGYGSAVPGRGVRLHTDRPLRHRVFFSAWAARAVARAIAADRRLRADLPFRPTGQPHADLGVLADRPGGASLRVLVTATRRPGKDVAAELARLVSDGAVEFGVAPAPYDVRPLWTMRTALLSLAPSAARDEWMAALDRLTDLLGRIERSPLPDRVELVAALQTAFTELTGQPAIRGEGTVYADRTVFYEECASPFALELGVETLAAWAERITPSLELSVAHGDAVQRAAVERVVEVLGAGTADLLDYAERARLAFDAAGSRFAVPHAPDCPVESVADLVALGGKLSGDRYALVDLCPTGPRADAPLVVARVHHHLLTDGWLATMYDDDRVAFSAAAREWVADQPDLVAVDVGRRNKGYYRFPGRYLVLRTPSHADAGPDAVWPRDVTVEYGPSGVRCSTVDGQPLRVYLALSDHVKYPPFAALSHPQVQHARFSGADPMPEVRVGEVLYQRPRWTLDPERLRLPTAAARFLELRRIAAETGERFVFVRTAAERKPYLVDLACVLAGDLAGHVARAGGELVAEAMRPRPDELWLRDGRGRRYTCELRVQVIGLDQ